MSFKFSMQRVLDYREQLEEEARIQFAVIQQRYRETQELLERILTDLQNYENRLYGQVIDSPGERWLLENFIKGLRSDAAEASQNLQRLEKELEVARQVLAQRARDKKLLVKLKERKQQQYIMEERLKEQRFNDEIATQRYNTHDF